MGVNFRALLGLAVACALISACGGSMQPAGTAPAALSKTSDAAMRASVQDKLRNGYMYQIRGTVHSIDVAVGKPPIFRLGPGDIVDISLVPAPAVKYLIHGPMSKARTAKDLTSPPDCVECDPVGGGSTPGPQSTPPPNYKPCSSAGGATWYNDSTGEGGCTPRGSSKPLTCGSWTWSGPGKGSLNVPGTAQYPDVDYVVDHGDGSCRVGYL